MTKTLWRKLFLRVFLLIIAAIVLFVIIFIAAVELTPFDASKLTRSNQPTVVYDRNGSVYMTIASKGADDLTYNQIPKNLRDAVVAIEDHNFWTGSSIDLKGLLRSAFVDLWTKSYAQGASTIQEQLAKIVYLTDKKTLNRKFQQIVLGVQIDRYFTKEEILAMYLNRVFLGENSVGVEEAAYRYFGVDLKKNPNALTLDQAALLAGLPQAPSAYDPIQHPAAALQRRNQVLEAMAKYGYITESQAKAAEQQPIGKLEYHSLPDNAWDTHPLFTNFLFDYAERAGISTEELLQGGLKIYTTLDPTVQSAIDQVFWSTNYNNDFPGPTTGTVVQGAALFVDPKTGGILGGAGSRKQGFVNRGYDRIYAPQQPGSSIKPLLEYGAAIDSGQWGPNSILDNRPQDFGGGYIPQNDEANAPASITLKDALATSQNVASVWLLKQIGLDNGIAFAERLGIPFTSSDRQHLGVAIGNLAHGVNTMQMAYAYEAYANNGVQEALHLISKITNPSGETIYSFQPAAKRVVSAQTAQIMTQLLEGVVQYGTGTQAQVPGWDVAGKTGTVQYDASLNGVHQSWIRNAWFDGYTPTMLGSIYIGYDNPDAEHHMTDIPYASSWYCARIFGDIVKLATAGQTPQHFNFTALPSSQPTQQQQAPVSGLSFQWDAANHALQLSWSSPLQGQVSFVVKRTDAQGTTSVIGQTSQLSLEDSSVQPGMTYTYVVQAVDNSTGQPLTPAVSRTITIQGGSQAGGNSGQAPSNNVDNSTSPGTPSSPSNSPTTPGNVPGVGNSPTPGNSTEGTGQNPSPSTPPGNGNGNAHGHRGGNISGNGSGTGSGSGSGNNSGNGGTGGNATGLVGNATQ
ncbi:transglycosylase domain-containing protein [Alicyclobacillus pomorum]|uniref:transglycosylase domain-containing protein n=1 Tax=Alicyclobacillus pomorum TaxID=204470 RepID=UPI0004088836|nr:transglycosylase domain-containing protein [Alicyclobacillus pomorum]